MNSWLTNCFVVLAFLVSQAAGGEREWPFYVPKGTKPPEQVDSWVRNDIDRFVLHKLQENGLRPSNQASKRTLVRRLYFDVIGLPPTPEEVDKFLNNASDDAYTKFWLSLRRAMTGISSLVRNFVNIA